MSSRATPQLSTGPDVAIDSPKPSEAKSEELQDTAGNFIYSIPLNVCVVRVFLILH